MVVIGNDMDRGVVSVKKGVQQQQQEEHQRRDIFGTANGVASWRKVEQAWMGGADEIEQELLPGLPDSLVLELILTRVPWLHMVTLSSVSRAWRSAIRGRKVCEGRLKSGSTQMLIAINQLFVSKDGVEDFQCSGNYFPKQHVLAISLYDMSSCVWKHLPQIPGFPEGHPCSHGKAFVKGRMFVLGGFDPKTLESSAEVYMLDLGAGLLVWQKCARMLHPRQSFACSVVDGKVYVAGGHSFPVYGEKDDSIMHYAEVYDPEENVWHALPDLAFDWLEDCRELMFRQRLFVVLGLIDEEPESAFLYDPTKGLWSLDNSLVEPYPAFGWEYSTYFEMRGEYFSLKKTEALLFDKSKQLWEPLQYSDGTCFNTQQHVDAAVGTLDGEVFARVEADFEGNNALMISKGFWGFTHGTNKLEWEKVPYPVPHQFEQANCFDLWSIVI